MPSLWFNNTIQYNLTINIDEDIQYQTMEGFGAALTDSSAWLFANQLSNASRLQYLQQLFNSTSGIGLSALRIPLGASDFALNQYTYDDMPANQTDPNLTHFSINHDLAYIIPVLQQIISINPDVWLVSTPWSQPGWMKTTDSLDNGSVIQTYYNQFAQYYVKFLQGYQQNGIQFDALTVQNEPLNAPCNYPCTLMQAPDQAEFIADYLKPQLTQASLDVKILIWDHNWDVPQFPLTVLQNDSARAAVEGVAWHCYAGEVLTQTLVRNFYPDKGVYFTECSGGEWSPNFGDNLNWFATQLIIGAPRNWAKTVIFWNLALDQNYGPNDGGCQNCRGVITIPSTSDNNTQAPQVSYNVEYYCLGHASKFVKKGAIRIFSNIPGNVIQNVAYINKDGSYTLIVMNGDSKANQISVSWQNKSFAVNIPAGALATFTWKGNN